jgi:hypothetical protein
MKGIAHMAKDTWYLPFIYWAGLIPSKQQANAGISH